MFPRRSAGKVPIDARSYELFMARTEQYYARGFIPCLQVVCLESALNRHLKLSHGWRTSPGGTGPYVLRSTTIRVYSENEIFPSGGSPCNAFLGRWAAEICVIRGVIRRSFVMVDLIESQTMELSRRSLLLSAWFFRDEQ